MQSSSTCFIVMYITQLLAVALIVFPLTSTQGADCIARSRDLSDSIFNNTANGNDNWDNLRRAYFPPNNRENQIVTILYYCQTLNNSFGNYSVEKFRWSWSPAVFFIYPNAFKQLALLVVDLNEGEASVYIATPFCNITNESRLSLLNEFTTVLRGYVVNGYSPDQQRIDVHQIGYASYYNLQNDMYETRGAQSHIEKFFWMLIVASAVASCLLPLFCGPCFLGTICKKHFGSCDWCACTCSCKRSHDGFESIDGQARRNDGQTDGQTQREDGKTPRTDGQDQQVNAKLSNERRSFLVTASFLVSNSLGIYALIIDSIHIDKELKIGNHSPEHKKIYNGWIVALVAVFLADLLVACVTNLECIYNWLSLEDSEASIANPLPDQMNITPQEIKKFCNFCNFCKNCWNDVIGFITNCKTRACCSCPSMPYCCRTFCCTLSLFLNQVLLFHLIYIGLAYLSYPVQALGIIAVVLSVTTMCIISIALACFAFSRNVGISFLILIISLFLYAAYAITLVSLVFVTEFFDYTDDFEDNTVTSISAIFLSAVITAGPAVILFEQYNHLCEIIERVPRFGGLEVKNWALEQCKKRH